LRIPSNIIPSLKKIEIIYCHLTTFQGNKEGISGFISLEELRIVGCDELISSLVHEDEIDDQANGRWLLPCSLVYWISETLPWERCSPASREI